VNITHCCCIRLHTAVLGIAAVFAYTKLYSITKYVKYNEMHTFITLKKIQEENGTKVRHICESPQFDIKCQQKNLHANFLFVEMQEILEDAELSESKGFLVE
jgi:hypothetical protein